jgi:hypothetical protein
LTWSKTEASGFLSDMNSEQLKDRQKAFRVSLIYVIVAGSWILFSDEALKWLISDPNERSNLSVIMGWGFVIVTGWLLYSMLRHP